jgi:hypothetical protein
MMTYFKRYNCNLKIHTAVALVFKQRTVPPSLLYGAAKTRTTQYDSAVVVVLSNNDDTESNEEKPNVGSFHLDWLDA